jgi:hypothetical protein
MDIYQPYIQVSDNPHKGKFSPRKEQEDAINKAFNYFSRNREKCAEFLWNAKMRFGKTVSALWLIEQLYKKLGKRRVLIVTHRPVVNASWYGDFQHLFKDDIEHFSYGTARETDVENRFKDFYTIKNDADKEGKCVVFFASMQYLRLSKIIRGVGEDNSQIKQDILNYKWDLVIIDEAHEGTQTELGAGVINYLKQNKPFVLYLSGTPFNLLDEFKGDQIYNWDYIKEQQTKKKWDETHPNEINLNPYRELPEMSLMCFRISDMTNEVAIKDAATGNFSFTEFFRVKSGHNVAKEERGKFVHEEEVLQFLMTMWKEDTGYPYSTDKYRRFFRHTLWVVPGVKEAIALKSLIENRTPLCQWGFKVVNVAGEQEQKENALDKVFKAMKVDPKGNTDDSDQTYTITISCGRLTTGVTVKPWTAVLYMKGSETTSASTYMQTIFRVQSPHLLHGMMKNQCYVFDFAPERALVMMAETAKYSRAFEEKENKNKKKQKSVIDKEDKKKMEELIETFHVYDTDSNGCPILVNGKMQSIEPERLFSQLTRVYVDKVVRNGFDHPSLYNYDEFLKLELEDEMNLNYISGIFDDSASDNNSEQGNKVEVNHQDYTPEQLAALEEEKAEREAAAKKAREEAKKKYADKLAKMTDEEREKFLKEKEENARKLKLIHQSKDKLTGLSKRIPLMMYGANVKDFKEVTIDNFTDKRFIDDESWNEFMPNGVTRQLFRKLTKFYNPDVFKNAGIRIRQLAREADSMKVEERIARIAQIFKWFKNPDKETVLTPWEVVNRHMSSTLGGYCFFEDDFKTPVVKIDKVTGEILDTNEPRFIDQGEITKEVFGDGTLGNIDELQGKINTKILEINSKTGLYPLYVAYSLYRHLLPVYANEKGLMADNPEDYSAEDEHAIWDEVVSNNLYVICNTKMAERITRRTLLGFRTDKEGKDIKLHVRQDQLVKRVNEDRDNLIANILDENYWMNKKMKGKELVFNAVVGNPPYQGSARVQLYPTFYKLAQQLGNIATLIFPTGWQRPCAPTAKGLYKLNNSETKSDEQIVFINNCHDLFPGISGANEINIILWKKGYKNGYEGKQMVYTDGANPELRQLEWEQHEDRKPLEIQELARIVDSSKDFISLKDYVSAKDPFKLPTDIFLEYSKYKVSAPTELKINESDIMVFGGIKKQRAERFIPNDYPILKKIDLIHKYKVFVPWAWGNMDEKAGLGGAFADIIVASPQQVCTMTYNTCGIFDTRDEVVKHAKYMMTKFFRALLYMNKDVKTSSQNAYSAIPLQKFEESWWNDDIDVIDEELFKKYNIPDSIRSFVRDNIQTKSMINIINIDAIV